MTAVAALESVYPVLQVVSVRREDPTSARVRIRIEGPQFAGEISMLVLEGADPDSIRLQGCL